MNKIQGIQDCNFIFPKLNKGNPFQHNTSDFCVWEKKTFAEVFGTNKLLLLRAFPDWSFPTSKRLINL